MSKQVQIDENLFINLYKIIVLDIQDENLYNNSKKQLDLKFNKIINRSLYSKYKTAETEEERNNARIEYLNSVGIPIDFRW